MSTTSAGHPLVEASAIGTDDVGCTFCISIGEGEHQEPAVEASARSIDRGVVDMAMTPVDPRCEAVGECEPTIRNAVRIRGSDKDEVREAITDIQEVWHGGRSLLLGCRGRFH